MNNFLIYRSSAGSGKTYTLVKEYLKLVLNDPENFKSTLAVTFTNKAAAEMKSRIISALIELSHGENESLKQLLIAEGVKADIGSSSAVVLKNILHKYSYFSVSTIDSFFHKVIRSFAKELKLQLGYNIELNQNDVLDKITDRLLDDAGIDEELTGFLENYIYYSIEDEKGWKIDLRIKELAKEIFTERYMIRAGKGNDLLESRTKLKEFIGILFAIKNEFESRMKLIAADSAKILDHFGLTIDDFPFKKSGFMNYLLNRITKDDYDPKSRAREAAGDIKKCYGKNTNPKVKQAAEGGLFDLLSSAVENYDKNFVKYNTAIQLIRTIYITGIFKDLIDKLKKYRDDNNVLMISDINNILLNVISGQSSPFVFEKIGSYYRNFLIDEFQDTSTFQWQNFLPLIENSLSENNSSLIVGDVKQSIYRWRNGNMKLLLEDAKNDLAGFLPLIKEESLNVNYRSKKRIVDFNNAFFKTASGICANNSPEGFGEVITKAYADTSQKSRDISDDGYVNIRFYVNDRDSGVTSRELAGENMLLQMKSLLDAGYMQKDIMVLVRGNQDALEAAQLLIYAGLKVISSDSLLLTNSPKVRLLLNLFKYIVDNNNFIARTEILYNYLIYFKNSDVKLNDIFTDHFKGKGNARTLFKELLPVGFFENGNGSEVNLKLSGLGLYDLAEELIMIFSIGGSADTYLLRFLDVLKKYSAENNSDVYGFVKWWEENKSDNTIVVPEEEDAIRLMTIHKAKGLQSPVVFIPYANWDFGFRPGKSLIWVSSDKAPFERSPAYFVKASSALENSYFAEDYNEEKTLTCLDNLNLMYVAFTRAEEKLFISVPRKGSNTFGSVNVIEDSIKNNPELALGFNAQNFEYESGLNNKSEQKTDESKEYMPYIMYGLVSGNIFEKIIVKPEFEHFVPENKTDITQLKNRGIIIHKALSLINNASEEEIRRAINKLIISGLITIEQKDNLLEELKKIFSIRKVKNWFNPEFTIMNERDIILPGGNIYRPDKVIIDEDKAIVVDFKTGSRKNEHTDQVKMYGKILADMGYKEIEMSLFYINDLKIETVK